MAVHTLKNEAVSIQVTDSGAELLSLMKTATGAEYLWNGDPAYWMRRSPILFPFVGLTKNKEYRYEGITYPAIQHGFARDMEFTLKEKTEERICHKLTADDETRKIYPFDFSLFISYILEGNTVTVQWDVINEDIKTMYFSIGGHPGFYCPLAGQGKQTDCYLGFDTERDLEITKISKNGLVVDQKESLKNERGLVPVTEHMFDEDALIVEHDQAHRVFLADGAKKPYLTVDFDAPLFGIWSPAKKQAPFICIEPWYGRCDREDFAGELKERQWGQSLEPGERFTKSYKITVH